MTRAPTIPTASLLATTASLLATLLVGASACPSGFTPPPPAPTPTTNPQAPADPAPAEPPADPAATPSGSIADALQHVPGAIDQRYVFSLSADHQELTIDPRPQPARRAIQGARGFSAVDSENGGKIITLDGGPFRNGRWAHASFRERVSAPAQLEELRRAGYDLDEPRDLLVVDGQADPSPTVFAFSADAAKPGIVGVCTAITIIDFGASATPPRPIAVRKPVVYLYPEATTRVNVRLELDGALVAHYPALPRDGWTVTASPTGELVDETTGRHHRYLFWEGTSAGFELDPAKAHCVPGDEAAGFMEHACDRFALTDAECGDLVTYWLPKLASNPYSVIQFVDEPTYARYAALHVTPRPDTVIRPFMIFRRSEQPVAVGAPELPQRTRRGFTVVEWGGADLDEVATPAIVPR
jgi:hypothetical protein